MAEHPVKMGEGLKAHRVSNLADPQMRVQKQGFGLFDTDPTHVISECQTSRFLKHLTEIKRADVHRFRDFVQTDRILVMSSDIGPGPAHQRRFGFGLTQRDLIGYQRQVLAKNFQKADDPSVLASRKHLRIEVSLSELLYVNLRAPLDDLPVNPAKLGL